MLSKTPLIPKVKSPILTIIESEDISKRSNSVSPSVSVSSWSEKLELTENNQVKRDSKEEKGFKLKLKEEKAEVIKVEEDPNNTKIKAKKESMGLKL